MGAFEIKFTEDGPEQFLPNVLHDEGAEVWLRYLFPTQGAQPNTFALGVSGVNTGYPGSKPNPGEDTSREDLLYGDLIADGLNPAGGFNADFRGLVGLDEQTTSFTVTAESGGVRVETPWHQFSHALAWEPTPDSWYAGQDPPLTPPYPWRAASGLLPAWEPILGWPWHTPRIRPETLRPDPATPNPTTDPVADNPLLGTSMPLGLFYIRTGANELLVSAVPKRFIPLPPSASLWVRWVGRLCPSLSAEAA